MRRPTTPSDLISTSRIDALILTSSELKRKLLPEGLLTSPYEILRCQHTLVLHDAKGLKATFQRTQQIRFLQNGVAGILDNLWGDGVTIASYHTDAGRLEESFRDQGRRHLLIGLKRTMRRGDGLTFRIERLAIAGFTAPSEWFETTLDRPVQRVRGTIVFPRERPCYDADLWTDGEKVPLALVRLKSGQTVVSFTEDQARADTPYTIRWSW